jgi:hypothetical protein
MAGLGQQLRSDHVRLGRVFEQLLEAAERGDQGAVGEMWADFESGLLAHFEGEEKHLFPLVERVHPEEVQALREEHAKIREMLARAAGAGATPTLSRQAAAELEATVSKHARREDGLLYCLADAASDEELSRSLRDYMDRTYSALRHLPADD